MNKEEYENRMSKLNARLSTDRCSVDEEYYIECQKNYLNTKYIAHLQSQLEQKEKQLNDIKTYINYLGIGTQGIREELINKCVMGMVKFNQTI